MNSGTESPPLPLRRVLVVDDSLSIQQTVHQAFAGTPHVEVSACGDVPAAETLLAQRRHDLVLCDVVLPGRPGYELCEQITRGTLPDRPLVYLLTGNFEPFDPERARQVGADDVISKPFSPEDLRLRLLNVLAPPARVFPDSSPGTLDDPPAINRQDVVKAEQRDGQERLEGVPHSPSSPGLPRQESAIDELVRRMLDPLTRRLVEPVTEAVLARLRQPEGPLGNNVAGTLRQVVEELVRQRLEEIENSVPPGEEGSDGSGAC